MASPEVYDAIRAFLETNWTTSPLRFENEDNDRDGKVAPPDPPIPWVNVEVLATSYAQESIGASVQAENRWDEEGQLLLDVSVRSGTGTRIVNQHCKSLAFLFRGLTLLAGGLEFTDVRPPGSGAGDNSGNWWTKTVSIDWRWMEAS